MKTFKQFVRGLTVAVLVWESLYFAYVCATTADTRVESSAAWLLVAAMSVILSWRNK